MNCNLKKVTLVVDGMKCSGCVKRIENILSNISEISSCQVDLNTKQVQIFYENSLNIEQIIEKIENLGFHILERI